MRSLSIPGPVLLVALLFAVDAPADAQAATPQVAAPARPRPNIVLVFTDDQGWGDIGTQGAQGFATPNLDRMAAEGVRLTDFYVAQPVCSASRAALLTGCYPNRIGITGALGPSDVVGIHDGELTLGELLQAEGYATALFGKWHLGHHPEFSPLRHGFDTFHGIPYSNDMWPRHPENPEDWPDLPTLEGSEVIGLNTDQSRFTGDFTARAIQFIEDSVAARRPFFVYLAQPMPHVPLAASQAFVGHSAAGLYGDVIEELDASVGALLETLERTGVDDNTLFLFSSDNGPWLSYGDHAGSSGPLREGKGTTFEGGVRVPFLARWPGHIPPGSVCGAPAMTIDVLPTIAGLLDTTAGSAERPIDGLDIWPLLSGAEGARSPHAALFFYYHQNNLEALRSGRWKLHLPHSFRTTIGREPGSGGQPGGYDYDARIGLALFDLEQDPGETRDVAAAHPRVVRRMLAQAEHMRAELGDELASRAPTAAREPGRHTP